MKIRIFTIGNATISLKADQAEHDELVRLREENKYLKKELADREEDIREHRRLTNHFIGQT